MSVLIVGLGGLGLNAVQRLIGTDELKALDAEILMIDGSDSDLNESYSEDFCWLVDGTEGAGKKRDLCYEEYSEFIRTKLSSVPVADMYILVYSLSGGSGSTLGPVLNKGLMDAGKNTINVVLGTSDCYEDVKNTRNTLAGLGNNVNQLGRPIHLVLESNDHNPESVVDAAIHDHILAHASISGNKHQRLDKTDISAWLNYQTRGATPMLTMIERFHDTEALNQMENNTISTLSLVSNADTPIPKLGSLLSLRGISPRDKDTHFVTTTNNIAAYKSQIDKLFEDYSKSANSLSTKQVFGNAEAATEDGMVF